MKHMLLEMFSAKGRISAMRAMSMLSLLAGIGLAAYGLYRGSELYGLAALCTVFVGSAFGGKAAQKAIEKSMDKRDD